MSVEKVTENLLATGLDWLHWIWLTGFVSAGIALAVIREWSEAEVFGIKAASGVIASSLGGAIAGGLLAWYLQLGPIGLIAGSFAGTKVGDGLIDALMDRLGVKRSLRPKQ